MNDSWAISRLVAQIKDNWRRGQPPDAEAALNANPYLRRWKSIVLDLAVEEYQLRAEVGDTVDASDFCRRFPDYQRSLLHRLEVEQYLHQEEERHALAWPEPGEVFLGYRLLQQLGKGAVGRVFLAQQVEMRDRLVVVKIAPRGAHEAHTLAQLNHPHIVPVYRYDEDSAADLAAICMPFLSRTTLEDFLATALTVGGGPSEGSDGLAGRSVDRRAVDPPQPWPPQSFPAVLEEMRRRFAVEEFVHEVPLEQDYRVEKDYVEGVLDLGRRLAQALAHTHQRGVLHLDLKPSNVLLLPNGRPMLLDFNLSVDGTIGVSVIGGTLPYMSPEQLQEAVLGRSYSSRPVDARSDIFSLGVMLYELLTGRHPFGETPRSGDAREAAKELLRRHEAGPVSLRERNPEIDKEIAFFLESCLAFHPDQRPKSAEAAAATLGRFLTPRCRFRRWRRKRRKPLAGVAAVFVAAALALGAAQALAPPEHERLYRAAQASLEERNLAEAEELLRQAVLLDKEFVAAWDALGRVQRDQRKFREAAQSFREAHRLSGDSRFFAEIGHSYFQAEQFNIAAVWYGKAIDNDYRSAEVHLEFGQCLSKEGVFDSAKVHLDDAEALGANSVELFLSRAINEMNWANRERRPVAEHALSDIREAVELAPADAEILFHAAVIHALAPPEKLEVERIRQYLEHAVGLGLDPKMLRSRFFRQFESESWFRELASR